MEEFFQVIGKYDEVSLYLHILNTKNAEFTLSLPVDVFCQLIDRIAEEKRREEIRQQWVSMLPMMSTGVLKYKTFEEYYDQCTGKNIDTRSTKDILDEVAEIRKERKES